MFERQRRSSTSFLVVGAVIAVIGAAVMLLGWKVPGIVILAVGLMLAMIGGLMAKLITDVEWQRELNEKKGR